MTDQLSWAEWNSFVETLPHPGTEQDVDPQNASSTFTPSLALGFERHVLNSAGSEVNALQVRAALRQFGGSEHSDDIQRFEKVVLETSPQRDLPVLLVYIYTMQTFFFKALNAALRADDEEILPVISPLIRSMMKLSRMTPKNFSGNVIVYRGFPLEEEESKLYAEGLVFCWAAFGSCSKEQHTAERFAGHGGAVFVIHCAQEVARECLADIEDLSYFAQEKEVLMSPYTSLVVREVSPAPNHQYVRCEVVSSAEDISGVWDCAEDGGVYFVTCVGQLVAWFGHARPGSGFSWAHVFFGSLNGNLLQGTFGDVPVAADRFSGQLEVEVDFSRMRMTRTSRSTAFMGRTWQRRSACVLFKDSPRLSHCAVARDSGISGVWHDGNGAVFFVREYGEQVFWFAHTASWSFAHVAMGHRESDGAWLVVYHDIILSTRFRFTGKIRVVQDSDDLLFVERLKGPFGSEVLHRS